MFGPGQPRLALVDLIVTNLELRRPKPHLVEKDRERIVTAQQCFCRRRISSVIREVT